MGRQDMASSAASTRKNKGLVRKAWRILCSIRLAAVLLLAVILILILGTLFPQRTWELQVDQAARTRWMAAIQERYAPLDEVYRRLGLFNIYSSPVFLLLLAGLFAAGVACTIARLRPVWRTIVAKPGAARPDTFYEKASNRAALKVASMTEARKGIVSLLSRARYRLLTEEREGVIYISGRKNSFADIGSLISHSALILVAVGVLLSRLSAWREPAVILGPGQVYDVGHGHDFQVRHDGFEIDRSPQGQPQDYRSHLAILRGESEVTRKTIRVNDPLIYEGVTFYLSSSGPALRIVAWDSDGQFLPIQSTPGEQAARGEAVLNFFHVGDEKGLYLPTLDITLKLALNTLSVREEASEAPILFLEALQRSQAEPVFSDYVHQGEVVQLAPAKLKFIADRYSVLQVVSDPGFIPVVGGGFLGLAGLLISFYFYPSRVWVKLDDGELLLAGSARRQQRSFGEEFDKMVTKLEEKLR